MDIEFRPSAGPSLGIEVELELIDVRTGELASAASDLLHVMGAGLPDGHPKAKHELFECCVEVITGICHSVAEARADLEGTIAELRGVAAERGLTLICSGTHPFSRWSEQQLSPDPRYAQLVDEMQWTARRLQIFGVHVHVGVRSAEKAVAIANGLTTYIPHLLALTGSSPYWEGADTGLASSRSKIFESLPTAGLPAEIEDWDEFQAYLATLVAAGAISTVREVWWDIRPHPDFGTVELRMCDGIPTMGEVASVAALAQCLVEHLDRLHDAGSPASRSHRWILAQNKWRAARHGLEAQLIVDEAGTTVGARDAISALVADLAPIAHDLGCADELAAIHRILDVGPSYQRQRAVGDGGRNLWAVVDLLARELATDEIA